MEPGRILGHENLGTVIEIGSAVDCVKLGDRVCMPFNISCGFCENCERGLTGFCLTTNPGNAGAAYGFAGWGHAAAGRQNCYVYPEAYENFDARKEGWTKVILKPGH